MQLRGPRFSFHLEPAGRVQVLLLPDAARVRKFLLPGAGGAEEVQQTHVNQHPNNGLAEKDLSHPDKRSRKDGPHGQASFSIPWQPASNEGGGGGWGACREFTPLYILTGCKRRHTPALCVSTGRRRARPTFPQSHCCTQLLL